MSDLFTTSFFWFLSVDTSADDLGVVKKFETQVQGNCAGPLEGEAENWALTTPEFQ